MKKPTHEDLKLGADSDEDDDSDKEDDVQFTQLQVPELRATQCN
jgi:hypothetical protein